MNKHRQKLLIVDDIPINIEVLNEALEEEYEVLFATDGKNAIEIAVNELPDLILLDIVMPDIDGYQVCSQLKNKECTKNIPIIFITSKSDEEDETKGLKVGAIDYIIKPFSIPIVKARVRNHVELKRRGDLLESLSMLDGLTGIPNRRRFEEYLDQEWRRSVRERSHLSIILLDIDFFKNFNDNYGHLAGDDCLKKVAMALNNAIRRPADLIARYGGEEFVCVMPCTKSVGGIYVAENIRKSISELRVPHSHSSVGEHVTISLGVATCIPNGDSLPEELINAADKQLYLAKSKGRNQVRGVEI